MSQFTSLPPSSGAGWGAAMFGASPWGGAGTSGLQVVSALALAENLVQIMFSVPVYFSGLLDIPDSSSPTHFAMSTVSGTVGLDGNPVRPCSVASVAVSTTDLQPGNEYGTALDLTLDRPMSPFPAAYIITCSGLYSADFSSALDPSHATAQFPAVYRQIVRPSVDLPTPTRDIANPQSFSNAQGLPSPQGGAVLGVFQYDDSHDYAIDSGIQSFKKRMYRRAMTKPGGFLHLGQNYGVGIPQQGKKLATAAVQNQMAAQFEVQVGQEPEVQAIKATMVTDPSAPGLVRLQSRVKLKSGKTFEYSMPFTSGM